MREEYEQLELDTRSNLNKALRTVTNDAIATAQEMILENQRQTALENQTAMPFVRNRHEAFGIASEQLTKISAAIKPIKNDIAGLLRTLPDSNFSAVEATSAIANSASDAAFVLICAAAEMKRTLDNLYTVELSESPPPLEVFASVPEPPDEEDGTVDEDAVAADEEAEVETEIELEE